MLALYCCVNKTSQNVNTKQQLLLLAVLRVDSAPLKGSVAPCCVAEDTHTAALCWQPGWDWNVLMAPSAPPPHRLVFHPSGTSSKMKPSKRTSPCVLITDPSVCRGLQTLHRHSKNFSLVGDQMLPGREPKCPSLPQQVFVKH